MENLTWRNIFFFIVTITYMKRMIILTVLILSVGSLWAEDQTNSSLTAKEKQTLAPLPQETIPIEINEEQKLANEFEQIKEDRILRIRNELVVMESQINSLKRKLEETDLDMVSKIQADSQLNAYKKEYEKKLFLFIETATDIDLNHSTAVKPKTDFFTDIQQILSPALNSIKQLSEKPRQIQELMDKAKDIEVRYQDAVKAQTRLETMLKKNDKKALFIKFKQSIKKAEEYVKELGIQREDIKFKIIKIEKDQEPFITTFSNLILDFIKTKGLNLLFALVIFIAIFWGFRIGQGRFISVISYRINRSDKKESYQWIVRPIRVLYNVFSIAFAFFLSILTLYALNDWVLVTFILITVAALVWSSKGYLPLFLEQSKIVLNLGAIREGERIMYHGIPWQIKSLGYYCHLYNPVLSGGFLRINTRELLTVHSRRIVDKEPWFPTKTGDWVELDNKFAQVILQSPEQVILKSLGEEKTIFKADEFYSKAPTNLSQGFAIEFIFGVDYQHQKILFTELIPTFKERIEKVLHEKHEDMKESLGDLSIEFIQAGASSLDLRFFLKCNGNVASKKQFLTRSVQKEFVNVCNDNNYVIPFNQLTVHMEKHG